MKLSAAWFSILAVAATLAHAQYFSAGWQPGQPVPKAEETPVIAPKNEAPTERLTPSKIARLFDITTILSSSLSVSLFEKLGINITERLAGALERAKFWDDRVTLITDNNFQELIVEESLTAQEEQDRIWIIVISVTAGKQDTVSQYMDQVFDAAFNESIVEGDLPNVRWGRIDYFNVTGITTKWAVWSAPYLVILKDRGKTLRFYRAQQLRLKQATLRSFLQNEDWKLTPPWSSLYSPGGEREYLLDILAVILTKVYNFFILIPRWLLFILSGSLASIVINFLHRPRQGATAQRQKPQHRNIPTVTIHPPPPEVTVAATATPSSSSSRTTKRKK